MRLGLTAGAEADLYELKALHLPADTRSRVIECLKILETFPSAGRALEDELEPYRVWRGRGAGCFPSTRFSRTKTSSW